PRGAPLSAVDRDVGVDLRRLPAEWVELPEEPVRAERRLRRHAQAHRKREAFPRTDRVRGAAVEHERLNSSARDELLREGRAAVEADGLAGGVGQGDAEAQDAAEPPMDGLP